MEIERQVSALDVPLPHLTRVELMCPGVVVEKREKGDALALQVLGASKLVTRVYV